MREDHPPKVSVIVINARGTRKLEECLKFLKRTNYPNYEIIVVDCLTLNLMTWIRKFFPNVKGVHFNHDIGASASHNVGEQAANSNSKYLAFLDNDTYVTENWLTELVTVMKNDKTVGMAQAKILLAKDNRFLDHTGIAIDALGTWQTTRGLKEDENREVFEVFAASSAGCIVRREIFNEVGGFDPDYFIYDDDTDFSFRARLFGFKVVFVPSAVIVHHGEPTRPLTPEKLYHSAKNRICTMLKNYELKNLWWRLLALNFVTLMVSIGFFVFNRPNRAQAVMRGLFYPLKNFKRIWKKRLGTQLKRRIRDAELMNKGLIRNDVQSTAQDLKLRIKHAIMTPK